MTALLVSELLQPGRIGPASPAWVVLFAAATLLSLYSRGIHRRRLRQSMLDHLRAIAGSTAMAAITVLAVRVLVTDDPSAAGQTVRWWAFTTAFLALSRVVIPAVRMRRRHIQRATLIIGAGRVGQRIAKRLLEAPSLGLKPVAFLDEAPLENGKLTLPVLGGSRNLDRLVTDYGVEHVVITFSLAPDDVLLGFAKRCDELGIGVSVVPRLFERMNDRMTVEHVGGLPLISVDPTNPKGWQFGVKYAVDRAIAVVLLLVLAPLLAVTAVAVRTSLGSPILYRQRRVGCDGQEFDILKFRTMHLPESTEEEFPLAALLPGMAPGGVEGDDRRTRIGRFLRRTSIDELPQLVNVLRGEMSIIGPRPERPAFVEVFLRDVHRYSDRHRVRSGITGWAQVQGLRGKTSVADRVEWDNYYIDNWSLWLDLKVMLLTVRALVTDRAE
jgi:exopolysaccharide biosynthesis polyprenyl glycosylphosphotransferase